MLTLSQAKLIAYTVRGKDMESKAPPMDPPKAITSAWDCCTF